MRLTGLIGAFLWAGTALAGQGTTVTGQYVEDRSARVYGCGCEFSYDSVNAGRQAVLAWNVQSGEFQGENLAGLRLVAVMVAADAIVSDSQSARRTVLFVDVRAGAAQRRAGAQWIRSRFGEVLGRVVSEHEMPVEFSLEADSISVRVGDILALSMHPARLAEDTVGWATLLYDPLIKLATANLGTTSRVQYSGPDLRLHWTRDESAITGYYGTFVIK